MTHRRVGKTPSPSIVSIKNSARPALAVPEPFATCSTRVVPPVGTVKLLALNLNPGALAVTVTVLKRPAICSESAGIESAAAQ